MKNLVKSISGGQKGFTLIELLVVIAILGVIAAVVALNIAGFFGRGTLQAANTELHQTQTAIISAMADAETNVVISPTTNTTMLASETILWAGETGLVRIQATDGVPRDASSYVYGPFRAVYEIDHTGAVIYGWSANTTPATTPGNLPLNPWGPTIQWSPGFMNWEMG